MFRMLKPTKEFGNKFDCRAFPSVYHFLKTHLTLWCHTKQHTQSASYIDICQVLLFFLLSLLFFLSLSFFLPFSFFCRLHQEFNS